MHKPRLLIPITIQFTVRYLVRSGLLVSLFKFCAPIVLLGWQDDLLRKELENMGCEVYYLPKVKTGLKYSRLRKKIHLDHFDRIESCSTEIDRRRNFVSINKIQQIRVRARDVFYRAEIWISGGYYALFRQEQKLLKQDTNFAEFQKLSEQIKPDALFCLTPYFIEEEFLVRAISEMSIRQCAAILSFDNLTTRPRIPVLFDRYLLWNEYNRQELLRIYPDVNPQNIELVGSPQFDFYYDSSYLWDEITWRNRLGLPIERPVILFGAGPDTIAPVEPQIVAQLDDAIEQNQFPNKPIILLRLHPVDTPARWESLRQSAKHVIFDLPWQLGKEIVGKTNVSRYDIEKLVSTLKHSQVHINTSSTMTIDGAIFDRPQIGPAYDDRQEKKYDRAMRELYLREHYLPITNSGGLQIAYSFGQLKEYINEAFQTPERYSEERKEMVRALCTYEDGKSKQRVLNAIENFLNEGRLHSV